MKALEFVGSSLRSTLSRKEIKQNLVFISNFFVVQSLFLVGNFFLNVLGSSEMCSLDVYLSCVESSNGMIIVSLIEILRFQPPYRIVCNKNDFAQKEL